MRPVLTGTVLILALLTLSLCGVLMACMDTFTHYAVLAGAVSVPSFVLWFSAAVLALAVSLLATHILAPSSVKASHRSRASDIVLWHPLQLAFADGILNPKAF